MRFGWTGATRALARAGGRAAAARARRGRRADEDGSPPSSNLQARVGALEWGCEAGEDGTKGHHSGPRAGLERVSRGGRGVAEGNLNNGALFYYTSGLRVVAWRGPSDLVCVRDFVYITDYRITLNDIKHMKKHANSVGFLDKSSSREPLPFVPNPNLCF